MRHLITFFFATALASAQLVSFGVKAGVPATETMPHWNNNFDMLDTGRWTIGPTVEFRLLYGFSAEVDALYRGYRTQQSFVSQQATADGVTYPPMFYSDRVETKAWDIPVLLKYRIGSRRWRPFIDAGYTWTHLSSDATTSLICLGSADVCNASINSPYFHNLGHASYTQHQDGPTGGVGVEFKVGKIKIAPEIRYSYAGDVSKNQVTILAGFTY